MQQKGKRQGRHILRAASGQQGGRLFSNGANERTQDISGYEDGQIFLPDADDKTTESGVTTYGGTLDYYKVKNVILMIGDGMGAEQAKAGEIYKGSKLVMQTLPYSTMVTTYSNDGVTDSSAAATAMATGYKTNNNMVGMIADGTKKENLIEFSKARGLKAGVIVTQVLPHATPAGFTAHVSARYSYNSIAAQQLLCRRTSCLAEAAHTSITGKRQSRRTTMCV